MKRISFLAAAAAATLGSVVGASATVVGFSSFGGIYGIGGVPPGETVDTNFSSGLPLGATGDGSIYTPSGAMSQAGVEAGSYVAAPYTSTGSSTGKFFAVNYGQTETFTFTKPVDVLSFYIGSLDADNVFTLITTSGSTTWDGAQLDAYTSGPLEASGAPTITSSHLNGRFTFADGSNDIIGFKMYENTLPEYNSFEIAQIATATSSVPEPSTWAMMAIGFAGLGYASIRSRRTARAIA